MLPFAFAPQGDLKSISRKVVRTLIYTIELRIHTRQMIEEESCQMLGNHCCKGPERWFERQLVEFLLKSSSWPFVAQ